MPLFDNLLIFFLRKSLFKKFDKNKHLKNKSLFNHFDISNEFQHLMIKKVILQR